MSENSDDKQYLGGKSHGGSNLSVSHPCILHNVLDAPSSMPVCVDWQDQHTHTARLPRGWSSLAVILCHFSFTDLFSSFFFHCKT